MLTQSLRPSGISYTNGTLALIGGGTTTWGNLSDNNNVTRVKGTSSPWAYQVYNLTNPGTALVEGSQRVSGWSYRIRMARTAADQHRQYARMRLRDTDNAFAPEDTFGVTVSGASPVEYSSPKRSSGPGGRGWNNNLLNRLRLDITWATRIGGAVDWPEVAEAFVDVDFQDRPVISGVDLADYTLTTKPTVGWTFTGDGVDQVRFRVKVFRQVDTVVGGFDPATAKNAVWDSGERSGSARDIVLEKDLTNGVAYVPYVAGAQAWWGPEGPLWWSTYVAGPSRTVVLTPPAAVSPALALISTLPDYRALHTLTAGSPGGGASSDIQLEVLEKCFRLRGAFYNWAHPQISSTGAITLGVDGFYSRQAATLLSLPLDTAAPEGPGQSGARMISWTPSVGAFSGLDIGLDNNATADESPPYLWPAIPGLPMRASIWMRVRSGSFVTRLHHLSVDNTNVVVAGGDQAQGGTTTLTTAWQRLELAFTPPSAATSNVNPFFNGSVASWSGVNGATPTPTSAQFHEGSGAMRITPDGVTAAPRVQSEAMAIAAGQKVDAHAWMRSPGTTPTVGMTIRYYSDAAGTVFLSKVGALAAIVASTWTEYFVSDIAPANAQSYRIAPEYSGTPTAGQLLDVDEATGATAGAIYGRLSIENVTPTTGVEVLLHGVQVGPDPGVGAQFQAGIGRYLPFPPDTLWTPVRHAEAVAGIASAGKVYILDNELPAGRPVIYRTRSTTLASGQVVTGPWTYYNAYLPPPAQTILRDPYQNENVMIIKRDGRTATSHDSDTAVFHASGRDGDPISLTGWRGGTDGSMLIAWESALELKRVRDLVRSGRALFVQWHDGGSSYIQFTSRGEDMAASDWGRFNGEYIEKERP